MVSKGEQTRHEILATAVERARQLGLEGLSIGGLARAVGMSKSGLFAHFGSKQGLQCSVLEAAADGFVDAVVRPALRAPRGEPRLRALFDRWLAWVDHPDVAGGCPFAAAAWEFDDRPGPVRELISRKLAELQEVLARSARLAIAEGHFRADLDPLQFAFEVHGMLLEHHLHHKLLARPDASDRARLGLERLLADAHPKT